MNAKDKLKSLMVFNNLMHGNTKANARAFVMMAKKHYKKYDSMILNFLCLAMQHDNCEDCESRNNCYDSKWNDKDHSEEEL